MKALNGLAWSRFDERLLIISFIIIRTSFMKSRSARKFIIGSMIIARSQTIAAIQASISTCKKRRPLRNVLHGVLSPIPENMTICLVFDKWSSEHSQSMLEHQIS